MTTTYGAWGPLEAWVATVPDQTKVGDLDPTAVCRTIKGELVHSRMTRSNSYTYVSNTADNALLFTGGALTRQAIIVQTPYNGDVSKGKVVAFITEEWSQRHTDRGIEITITGPGFLDELARFHKQTWTINDEADPIGPALNDVGQLFSFVPGWSYDVIGGGAGSSLGSVTHSFDVSALTVLENIREQNPHNFFRLTTPTGGNNRITWIKGETLDASGVTFVNADPANDNEARILEILECKGSIKERASTAVGLGGGHAPDMFTWANVSAATWSDLEDTLPANYSASQSGGTITNDDLVTEYGRDIILKAGPFRDIEPLFTGDSDDDQGRINAAGTALFNATREWLDGRQDQNRLLKIRAIVTADLRPVQTVTVDYPPLGILSETWIVEKIEWSIPHTGKYAGVRMGVITLQETLVNDIDTSNAKWVAKTISESLNFRHHSVNGATHGAAHLPVQLGGDLAANLLGLAVQTITLDSQNQNLIFASPDGASGKPSFRALDEDDLASHVIADTAGLGPKHTTSGLTAGMGLIATGATTARFEQPSHLNLSNVTANQHHNQSHVLATTTALGPDHTVSGLSSGMVLRATGATTAEFANLETGDLPSGVVFDTRTLTAGAGLTGGGDLSANRTFDVGAGDGINVNANDIEVDVTDLIGNGLTESSNNIVLGTPSTLTVSTSNGVTASSHTHAITTSSDPGANAAILASNANGRAALEGFGVNTPTPSSDILEIACNFSILGARQITTNSNNDLVLNPNGTGKVLIDSTTDDSRFVNVKGATIDSVLGISYSSGSALANFISYGTSEISGIKARKARGTRSSPSAVQSGDALGRFGAGGYGAAFLTASTGYIEIYATETHGASAAGTNMRFFTTANGATSALEQMRINGVGNVGIGSTSPSSLLELGFATETLEFVDAGSASATEQDWIEVEVNGVVGYIRVYASK